MLLFSGLLKSLINVGYISINIILYFMAIQFIKNVTFYFENIKFPLSVFLKVYGKSSFL
jgi:hypothetical protein